MQHAERVEALLAFWFGGEPGGDPPSATRDPAAAGERVRVWFAHDEAFDAALCERFGEDSGRAARGELEQWRREPRSALALVLLLDQLPRNLHRGTPRAFACDAHAQDVCVEGIHAYRDRELHRVERAFFYMPLMHAEDWKLQQRSLGKFERLLADAPPDWKPLFETFRDHAAEHRDAVARFGRFPHRNRVLGRASTPEERAFLASDPPAWARP